MKHLILATLIILSCSITWAADFDKGLAAYGAGDYDTALAEWKPLAEQGYVDAQHNLGVIYAQVIGDAKEAVKWYTLAAEQGNAEAQYNLGLMYAKGQGVIQDNIYAHMWWNIAEANGYERAKYNNDIFVKRMLPKDISNAGYLTSISNFDMY